MCFLDTSARSLPLARFARSYFSPGEFVIGWILDSQTQSICEPYPGPRPGLMPWAWVSQGSCHRCSAQWAAAMARLPQGHSCRKGTVGPTQVGPLMWPLNRETGPLMWPTSAATRDEAVRPPRYHSYLGAGVQLPVGSWT